MKLLDKGYRQIKMYKLDLEIRRTGRHSLLTHVHDSHYISRKAT